MTKRHILAIILLLLCALPFMALCGYTHPVNDDYFYALDHIDASVVSAVTDSYMQWSGRYLATALSALNPLACGIGWLTMPVWSLLTTAFYFLSIIGSVCLLLRRVAGGRDNLLMVGTGLAALMLALTPSIAEQFYWFSASTAYTIPAMLGLLLIATLPYRRLLPLQIALALAVPGGNEVLAVLITMILVFVAITCRRRYLGVVALCAIAGTALVVLSPGNAVRMSGQLSSSPYLWTLVVSTGQTLSWFVLWGPSILLFALLYVMTIGRHVPMSRLFNIRLRWYALFFGATVWLAHIPPTLGLSSVMIGRTANVLLPYFVVMFLYGVQLAVCKHRESVCRFCDLPLTRHLSRALSLCFVFLVVFNTEGPIATAYTDLLTGKAQRYHEIRCQRDRIALEGKTNADNVIVFEPLGVTSRSLFAKDLETDPEGLFCEAYRNYHKLPFGVCVESDDCRFESNFDALFNFAKNRRE